MVDFAGSVLGNAMCVRIWRGVSPVGGKITWTRSRQTAD